MVHASLNLSLRFIWKPRVWICLFSDQDEHAKVQAPSLSQAVFYIMEQHTHILPSLCHLGQVSNNPVWIHLAMNSSGVYVLLTGLLTARNTTVPRHLFVDIFVETFLPHFLCVANLFHEIILQSQELTVLSSCTWLHNRPTYRCRSMRCVNCNSILAEANCLQRCNKWCKRF